MSNHLMARLLIGIGLIGLCLATSAGGQEPVAKEVVAGPSAVVTLAEGTIISVHDLILSDGGVVQARSEVGPFEWKWEEILTVVVSETDARPSRYPALLLAGGEVIHGEIVSSTEEAIEIKSELAGAMTVPLSSIEGILLANRLSGRAKAKMIARIRSIPRTGDAFLLANSDVLMGTVSQFGPAIWSLDVDGQPRSVEVDRLQGVALDPRLIDYERPDELQVVTCWTDGSRVAARSVRSDADKCEVQSVVGMPLTLSWGGERGAAIHRFDVRGGRAKYLSELDPIEERKEAYLDVAPTWRRDAQADGEPMRLAGQEYEHGLGMRSRTRLDYSVAGYDRFLSLIGIDDGANDEAGVIFRVLLDGKQAFESPVLSLSTAPVLVDLSLSGVDKISLVVDFGPRGDAGDLANWAGARLIRSKK
jgi:hypothetical protein